MNFFHNRNSRPEYGLVSTRLRVATVNIIAAVPNPYSTREILAKNVKRLMQINPEMSSNVMVEERSGGKVKKSTLDRIRNQSSACDIDTLSRVADAFGLLPWQLLLPDLDVKNPPTIRMGDSEKVLYEKLEELLNSAKGKA